MGPLTATEVVEILLSTGKKYTMTMPGLVPGRKFEKVFFENERLISGFESGVKIQIIDTQFQDVNNKYYFLQEETIRVIYKRDKKVLRSNFVFDTEEDGKKWCEDNNLQFLRSV